MKKRIHNTQQNAGIMLVECIVYIGVFLLVATLAFAAYHRFNSAAFSLRQSASDIGRTLEIGELWRSDVRKARSSPTLLTNENTAMFRIPQDGSDVFYSFAEGTIWRRVDDGASVPVLKRVKSSSIANEHRQAVNAWRWEIELRVNDKSARLRPLFSFQAAAPAHAK